LIDQTFIESLLEKIHRNKQKLDLIDEQFSKKPKVPEIVGIDCQSTNNLKIIEKTEVTPYVESHFVPLNTFSGYYTNVNYMLKNSIQNKDSVPESYYMLIRLESEHGAANPYVVLDHTYWPILGELVKYEIKIVDIVFFPFTNTPLANIANMFEMSDTTYLHDIYRIRKFFNQSKPAGDIKHVLEYMYNWYHFDPDFHTDYIDIFVDYMNMAPENCKLNEASFYDVLVYLGYMYKDKSVLFVKKRTNRLHNKIPKKVTTNNNKCPTGFIYYPFEHKILKKNLQLRSEPQISSHIKDASKWNIISI